ncbi:DUF4326 domain-containing protein [Chitinophaga lutea]|uniref:DUF4326 domain-containing protein n=1 Tax=Chitinophaga lutea TaxID=2488634 RepID=A0A3N4PA67_9BACT|nr:DUF4326 domain-containing protein [Chitinophaga lutea]
MTPQRIQRKRTKGWRMPPNTVSVTRPGKWGNPFTGVAAAANFKTWLAGNPVLNIHAGRPPSAEAIRAELAGKNLACWCKVGEPCHGDVLLEVANS